MVTFDIGLWLSTYDRYTATNLVPWVSLPLPGRRETLGTRGCNDTHASAYIGKSDSPRGRGVLYRCVVGHGMVFWKIVYKPLWFGLEQTIIFRDQVWKKTIIFWSEIGSVVWGTSPRGVSRGFCSKTGQEKAGLHVRCKRINIKHVK